MKKFAKLTVRAPIECGEIVCQTLLGIDVNVIASRSLLAEESGLSR